MTVERLNWACGPVLPEDWTNSDRAEYPEAPPGRHPDHLGAIEDGLPWADGHFDYVVTHHALCMLSEFELVPALVELRRVTKPGGWLRVSVPDMQQAIMAYREANKDWFPVDAVSTDEAFCRYVTQNGATRSIFTWRRLLRLLVVSGWEDPTREGFRASLSPFPGITDLDSRPHESIFMEAMKP